MLEREFKISRHIIVVCNIIVSFIMLINEDISLKMFIIPIFVVISFISCIIGKRACTKILTVSDKISNLFLKVIYFVSVLFIILFCMLCFVLIAYRIYNSHEDTKDLARELSVVFYYLISCSCMFIFLITPYIQALIILILRKLKK